MLIEMWGYAEGDPVLIGIVVVVIVIAAIVFTAMRIWKRRG